MFVKALRGCRSRVHFAKSLMIPKVRMFYGGLSTDFSTSDVENVSKKLQGEEIGRGLSRTRSD